MAGKERPRSIRHDAGGAGLFRADAIQHRALDVLLGRRDPLVRLRQYVGVAELHLTPAAVGQLVRGLEELLGAPLFHRSSTGRARLAPTDAAQRALLDIRAGFDRLALGFERLEEGSPELLQGGRRPHEPGDLAGHILIHELLKPIYSWTGRACASVANSAAASAASFAIPALSGFYTSC